MSYYKGICTERGKTVEEEYAFGYALSRILNSKTEENEFVDWYYSGNWLKINEGDDINDTEKPY